MLALCFSYLFRYLSSSAGFYLVLISAADETINNWEIVVTSILLFTLFFFVTDY